jgi:hypothetical protein
MEVSGQRHAPAALPPVPIYLLLLYKTGAAKLSRFTEEMALLSCM